MSFILNIDTSSETAQINIAENGVTIHEEKNSDPKDHAAFLQPAIQLLLKKAGITLNDISAVGVVHGPGSYTGLRVGMASAKGLCFALNIPMITVGSLEILAAAAIDQQKAADALYCPMIDARRMEVFTAVYDHQLNIVMPPTALILDKNAFTEIIKKKMIIFLGNGAEKWEQICPNDNVLFPPLHNTGFAMSKLCFKKFMLKDLTDLVYSEPLYLKEFYTS